MILAMRAAGLKKIRLEMICSVKCFLTLINLLIAIILIDNYQWVVFFQACSSLSDFLVSSSIVYIYFLSRRY